MTQINVLLPPYLKEEAQALVDAGHYASLSDLMRTALRKIIDQDRYRFIFNEFKREHRRSGAIVLENPRDVDVFLETIANKDERIKELFQPTRKLQYKKRNFKF